METSFSAKSSSMGVLGAPRSSVDVIAPKRGVSQHVVLTWPLQASHSDYKMMIPGRERLSVSADHLVVYVSYSALRRDRISRRQSLYTLSLSLCHHIDLPLCLTPRLAKAYRRSIWCSLFHQTSCKHGFDAF